MVREFLLNEAQKQDDVCVPCRCFEPCLSLIHVFIIQEDLLINLVIEQMILDRDPELGGAVQLSSIIRLLIDPENMMGTTNVSALLIDRVTMFSHFVHLCTED